VLVRNKTKKNNNKKRKKKEQMKNYYDTKSLVVFKADFVIPTVASNFQSKH
jgi:hypothetical protein